MSANRIWLACLLAMAPVVTPAETTLDAAKAFGALESVRDISLSPDGTRVAYIAPAGGAGTAVYTLGLEKGAVPKLAIASNGKPDRLRSCEWVSNSRLACQVFGVVADPQFDTLPFTREIAVDADGGNLKLLSRKDTEHNHAYQLGGGSIIDLVPDQGSGVLMARSYLPDEEGANGTRLGSTKLGFGVDQIDTTSLKVTTVESPREHAVEYISDGHGNVRIMGIKSTRGAIGDEASGAYTVSPGPRNGRHSRAMIREITADSTRLRSITISTSCTA